MVLIDMQEGKYTYGKYKSPDGIVHNNICDLCRKNHKNCEEPWDENTKAVSSCNYFRRK